jgi:hypothetical protein
MDPLVTVGELETYLQRTVDADAGELAVANASGIVRDFCRWPIAPTEDATWTLDGRGTAWLNLPTLYLTDVAEVRVDGEVIDPGTYSWAQRGQLYRAEGWPARLRCVEADVSHGYETTPTSVRAVVLTLAARSMVNPEGLRSKTVGGVSKSFVFETMRGDLSELQLGQIGGYRLP